jgi:hypothetical protein
LEFPVYEYLSEFSHTRTRIYVSILHENITSSAPEPCIKECLPIKHIKTLYLFRFAQSFLLYLDHSLTSHLLDDVLPAIPEAFLAVPPIQTRATIQSMPKLYDKPGTPTYATKQMLAAALHLYGRAFDFGRLQYRASAALRDLSKEEPTACSLAKELMSLFPDRLRISLYFGSEGTITHALALMREDPSQPFRVSHRNLSRVRKPSRPGVEAWWPVGYTAAECGSVPPKLIPVALSSSKVDVYDPEILLQIDRAYRTVFLLGSVQKNFSLWHNPGKTLLQINDAGEFPVKVQPVRYRASEKIPSIRNTPRAYAFVPGDTFPIEVDGLGILPHVPNPLGKAPKDLPLLVHDSIAILLHAYVAIDLGKPESYVYAPSFDGEEVSVVKAKAYKRIPAHIPTYSREGTKWVMNPAAALDFFFLLALYPGRAPQLREYMEHLGVEWSRDSLLDFAKDRRVELDENDVSQIDKLFGTADGLPVVK